MKMVKILRLYMSKHRPFTLPAMKLAKSHKKGTHLKHRPFTMPAMKLAKSHKKGTHTQTQTYHNASNANG